MSISSKIEALPPLRDLVERHGLWADKSFGQNYLFDLNLTRKIARAAGPLDGHTVFEIGPGPGGLTRALLMETNAHITAIEKDKRFIEALQPLIDASDSRLCLIEGDAMHTDIVILAPAPRAVIANLPYNIGTELLIQWLHEAQEFSLFILMFQKEVAERIAAKPGTKAYGRLAVITQSLCDVDILFHLPPGAFTPPPKVTSSVIRLKPKASGKTVPLKALEKLTAAAFGQRRKMLRQSLKAHLTLLESCGIDPQLRAENLSVDQFISLARHLADNPV
jgi:16S rRNA (adenine1518-N6/adenine1519-N6)-dimethyltransferase